jgi:hypothetical protein
LLNALLLASTFYTFAINLLINRSPLLIKAPSINSPIGKNKLYFFFRKLLGIQPIFRKSKVERILHNWNVDGKNIKDTTVTKQKS